MTGMRIALLAGLMGCVLAGCANRAGGSRVSAVSMADPSHKKRILRGIHDGRGDWRWTARVFSLSLDPPDTAKSVYLTLDFSLPVEVMQAHQEATLLARVNGREVGRQSYRKEGRYAFTRPVPAEVLSRRPAKVEFELDRSIQDGENREAALIVVSVAMRELEQTEDFQREQMRMAHEAYLRWTRQRGVNHSPERDLELMRLFHDLPTWRSLWFRNVRILKNPLDLWMVREIVSQVRPDFIVETGTYQGGTALYLAHTLRALGLENSRVLTVDIGNFNQVASADDLWRKYVEFHHGSSTDAVLVNRIRRRVNGRTALVALDSNHAMQHVLGELRLYSPMVTRGSYVIVEDTHLDGIPTHPEQGPGPMAAILQFMREGGGREFEQDASRERMGMTFNPGGWLRRK